MIYRNPHKIINFTIKINIDGEVIIPSDKIKYLGIIFDTHFDVSSIAPKLKRAVKIVSKLRHFVSYETVFLPP